MVDVKLVGVQTPGPQHNHKSKVGSLVSGVCGGKHVIALHAHDKEGQHFIALNQESGEFTLLGDTQLSYIQPLAGEIIVEPAESSQPFALPAAAAEGSALIVNAEGDVGVRLTIPTGEPSGRYFTIASSLKTGEPFGPSPRFVLKGFRLMLKVDGREEPLTLGEY